MSNRLHQLILGLAASGLAAGAWAQTGPDAPSGGAGPNGPNGPPHAWHDGEYGEHGEHGEHKQWGEDGRDGEWHHGRHHHHHHHHHHHQRWGGGGWGGEREGWHRPGGMMGGPGLMLARDLNLSDAQKQQIHTILSNARQNAQKDGKPAGGADDRLALMNPGDPGYAAAVQAAKKRAADRIQHMSDLRLQIYNVLTAEQKSEVQKRIAAWKTRMAQRGEGAKGPPAPASR